MDKVEDLAFEEALTELESIIDKLEGEGLTLDQTVTLYKRGRILANHCQEVLDTVELRVEKLATQPDGSPGTVPFEPDASR